MHRKNRSQIRVAIGAVQFLTITIMERTDFKKLVNIAHSGAVGESEPPNPPSRG
jgi:hypothetical protein